MESGANQASDDNELDAAAILLSLKTTPPSFPASDENLSAGSGSSKTRFRKENETTTGYIPMYDWMQAIPTLSYAGNTYNINLQMYNAPVRLVPVPFSSQNSNGLQEMCVAFIKFCQIHRDTLNLQNQYATPSDINDRLVKLWSQLSDDEKIVYSRVARNEMLLMQGKDISSSKDKVVKEEPDRSSADQGENQKQSVQVIDKCAPSLFRHPAFNKQQPPEFIYGTSSGSIPVQQPQHQPSETQKMQLNVDKTVDNITRTTQLQSKSGISDHYHELRKNTKIINQSPSNQVPISLHKSPHKQRSLSLSDNSTKKVVIRRAVSQDEISASTEAKDGTFAKPSSPETIQMSRKFLIRVRRHSMNDGILNSPMEKMNPYFAKNYSKSPLKTHPSEFSYPSGSGNPKTPTKVHHATAVSPKRNLSVTSLDLDSMLKSPSKRSKGHFSLQTDIFDFKTEPQSFQGKPDPSEQEFRMGEEGDQSRKADYTYSYSLLKGASKTSSVNPCFSSRKTLTKKFSFIPTIPNKCVSLIRHEYNKKCKQVCKQAADTTTRSPKNRAASNTASCHYSSSISSHSSQSSSSSDSSSLHHVNYSRTTPDQHKMNNLHHSSIPVHHKINKKSSSYNPSPSSSMPPPKVTMVTKTSPAKKPVTPPSPSSSDVTMVTSSSVDSLKSTTSTSSSSSSDSRKLELVNDSVLISHAIDEVENAELKRLKCSRRSHASGSIGVSDARHRQVYKLFREHGLNPTHDTITHFYNSHKDIFSCKSAVLLTIREVRQKIIKLQLM